MRGRPVEVHYLNNKIKDIKVETTIYGGLFVSLKGEQIWADPTDWDDRRNWKNSVKDLTEKVYFKGIEDAREEILSGDQPTSEHLKQLELKISKLEKVLQFYADNNNYEEKIQILNKNKPLFEVEERSVKILKDGGYRAREILDELL